MSDILRSAEAVWNGDLKGGRGLMNASSGVLKETPYTFATRFENAAGTNPEELLAAAHAACFSMAFAATLGRKGFNPEQIQTKATCFLSPQQPAGFKITKMKLETKGKVSGLDAAAFAQIAKEVECPVSNLLKSGLTIEVEGQLL
jgi:osmotically inducible protein OsmC